MFNRLLVIFTVLYSIILRAHASAGPVIEKDSLQPPPKVQREFRAAWVATVSNINWPSKPGLSTLEQQIEALNILDFLKSHNFNAVIFQVRPQADALYKSDLEPWSYYLTGQQGKAPEPFYDPLTFWIEAAHERGLELHVWLNPYRAHLSSGGKVTETSMVKKTPKLIRKLKDGYWWYDPTLQGTQDHTSEVVLDIVKRYDIDGVHFDDYFYPYPEYNRNEDFPDGESWNQYIKSGGLLTRGDWRRDGVNKFIERIYKEIKNVKPSVKLGISPFGIWRPGYPASVQGFDQYEKLYADARLWLNKGWLDYLAPQLYWPINKMGQSFPVLLGWWAEENTLHRHLWPGINVGRDSSPKNVNEIMSQIMISRGMLPDSKGDIHWSVSSVTKNPKMAQALIDGPYKDEALVPASLWLDSIAPVTPVVQTAKEESLVQISWSHPNEKDVFRWVVYYQHGDNWKYKILSKKDHSISLNTMEATGKLSNIAVTAVDYSGNESAFSNIGVDVLIAP